MLIRCHFHLSPLGPFIPAPPEVAMRMMRDQGGPPPFEPTGGPRPRRPGRGGLPMGGPSPILAAPLPPPHMHDPRKIRRLVLTCLSPFPCVPYSVLTMRHKQFISIS